MNLLLDAVDVGCFYAVSLWILVGFVRISVGLSSKKLAVSFLWMEPSNSCDKILGSHVDLS